jgi:O-methyltransferase involved in polyketide biosynthesis
LFERIAKLSAPGSRIAVEALSPSFFDPDYLERRRHHLRGTPDNADQTGGTNPPDIPDLWFIEERTDLRQWLTERGWAVTVIEALNLMQRYDRPPDSDLKDLAPRSVFIEGRLHTTRRCA